MEYKYEKSKNLEINRLKNDFREKEEHYHRERRRTRDFENEVFRNEEGFETDLKTKMAQIAALKGQIADLYKKLYILEENSKE